ncbi:urease accessory protein [Fulvimarina manganoxydans]|uniref:Urease accessory protein UreE n=1 Tax=Fulvimarina manganoxydans TaxID=937218 RepID=A0A1W2A069_9HYPH|nr:urease accessory protein UreE [Fulvimarina manganoxydans]SMC53708.1 urease accessory protein [Fulvimarina manganoxydans]
MIVGTSIVSRGAWQDAADTITLDEQARHRRRMAMVSDGGIAFLLDLAEAVLIRDGDAILLSDGRHVEVKARPESLLEVRGRNGGHLVALAWQIGNRHLPAELHEDRIVIRKDRVIAEMLEGLGARLTVVEASFDPEGGAYGDRHMPHHHHHTDHPEAGQTLPRLNRGLTGYEPKA